MLGAEHGTPAQTFYDTFKFSFRWIERWNMIFKITILILVMSKPSKETNKVMFRRKMIAIHHVHC